MGTLLAGRSSGRNVLDPATASGYHERVTQAPGLPMSATPSQTTDRGWHETRPWHPWDDVLRRHGFRIAGRPRKGPVRWERGGVLYAEAAARLACDAEDEARGES